MVGKALGLPYVDVEGFSMHPHRGIDIWTYILDGSDGFCHRDSLVAEKKDARIYRGGSAQFMRTGAGGMHEEFWETSPTRRTNIELFQLWVNLPARQKMEPAAVTYVGTDTDYPWLSDKEPNPDVTVRDLSATLEQEHVLAATQVAKRPPISIRHVTMEPRSEWRAPAPADHSVALYVREGQATLGSENDGDNNKIKALQSATFLPNNGKSGIVIRNADRRKKLDFLLLTGQPLREPVAWGGPIVMNFAEELNDAYRQLQAGTFLHRDLALRQHQRTMSSYFG